MESFEFVFLPLRLRLIPSGDLNILCIKFTLKQSLLSLSIIISLFIEQLSNDYMSKVVVQV